MSLKDSATLNVGYPIYAAKFINNKTVLVAGGGGEGNNGIQNKITAIKCSFKVNDPKRRLQKFREITLPANEDSPQCLDTAKILKNEESKVSVFVGCNQSTQLIKSMNINNNLRKYVFNDEEHLRFVDAAQLEQEINSDDAEHYPKLVRLSTNNTVGCFMTSKTPSKLYIFDPESLELKHKPVINGEIKDVHFSPLDDGKTLCFVTENTIETVETSSGNFISTTQKLALVSKLLSKYALSKVRFIDNENVIVAASVRDSKQAVLLQYSLSTQTIVRVSVVSKAFKNIVAIDINLTQGLIAIAGNDMSVLIIKVENFKVLNTFKKLHSFAVTTVAFSPNGLKLATGSAANTLLVFRLPANYSRGKSSIGSLFLYLLSIIFAVLLSIGLFKAHENGQLDQAFELTKHYGKIYGPLTYDLAQKYGVIGYKFVKSKIASTPEIKDTTNDFAINPLDSEEVGIVHDTFVPEEYVTTTVSTPELEFTPTVGDKISQVTKALGDITNQPDFNSESFFEDTANYVTEVVVDAVPAAHSVVEEVVSAAQPVVEQVVSVALSVVKQVTSAAPAVVEDAKEVTNVAPSVASEATSVVDEGISNVKEAASLPLDLVETEEDEYEEVEVEVDDEGNEIEPVGEYEEIEVEVEVDDEGNEIEPVGEYEEIEVEVIEEATPAVVEVEAEEDVEYEEVEIEVDADEEEVAEVEGVQEEVQNHNEPIDAEPVEYGYVDVEPVEFNIPGEDEQVELPAEIEENASPEVEFPTHEFADPVPVSISFEELEAEFANSIVDGEPTAPVEESGLPIEEEDVPAPEPIVEVEPPRGRIQYAPEEVPIVEEQVDETIEEPLEEVVEEIVGEEEEELADPVANPVEEQAEESLEELPTEPLEEEAEVEVEQRAEDEEPLEEADIISTRTKHVIETVVITKTPTVVETIRITETPEEIIETHATHIEPESTVVPKRKKVIRKVKKVKKKVVPEHDEL